MPTLLHGSIHRHPHHFNLQILNAFIQRIFYRYYPTLYRMIGGVGGRHMSVKRRGSQPMIRFGNLSNMSLDNNGEGPNAPRVPPRRRRAVTTSDHKSCALIQTRLKLGDIMWVAPLIPRPRSRSRLTKSTWCTNNNNSNVIIILAVTTSWMKFHVNKPLLNLLRTPTDARRVFHCAQHFGLFRYTTTTHVSFQRGSSSFFLCQIVKVFPWIWCRCFCNYQLKSASTEWKSAPLESSGPGCHEFTNGASLVIHGKWDSSKTIAVGVGCAMCDESTVVTFWNPPLDLRQIPVKSARSVWKSVVATNWAAHIIQNRTQTTVQCLWLVW